MILSLRNLAIFSIIAIVAGGTATWGLKTITYTQTPTPVQEEVVVGSVKLEIHLDKAVYKQKEKINITLTLTNTGNKTIFLSRSSPPVLDFVVYNESDQIIYAYSWGGFIAVVVSYPIEPGESFSRTFTWNQQGKLTQAVYQQVDLGTYFIIARTTPGGVLYDEEGKTKQITMETQKIQIEIES